MKKIFLILNIFALCILASCDKNEFAKFNDKDAFVAFGKANYAITEDGANLTIPVTLASIEGIETSVTVSGVDGTAVSGVDYSIKNGGVLNFNAQTRTANVEIEINNRAGEYTGDLVFTLQFSNLGSVQAGAQSTATVTIQDNDHPLSFILGTYNVTGTSYFNGPTSTYMTFTKDAKDVTKVWIRNLFCNPGWDIASTALYGVVSTDKTTITIPLGQATEYTHSGASVYLFGCDAEMNVYDAGNIIVNIKDGGNTLEFADLGPALYIDGAGYVNVMLPGIVCTKAGN